MIVNNLSSNLQDALYSYLNEAFSAQAEINQLKNLIEHRTFRAVVSIYAFVFLIVNSDELLFSLIALPIAAYFAYQSWLVVIGLIKVRTLRENLMSLGSVIDTLKREVDMPDELALKLIDRRISRLDPRGSY